MFRCKLSECGQGQCPANKLLADPFPEAWGARKASQGSSAKRSTLLPLRHGTPLPQTALPGKEPLEEKHLGPLSEFYSSWILEMQDSRELGARQSPPAVAANCRVGFAEIETVACQLRVHFPLMNYL